MRRVLFFGLFLWIFCSDGAFCASYELFGGHQLAYEGADSIWGNPGISKSYIQDEYRGPGNFRIKQGWACCGDTPEAIEALSESENAENCKYKNGKNICRDDMSLMVFIAKDIFEHGGWFCLTQLHAVSSYTGQFWIGHQQPNWPGMNCMVLCEVGWGGHNCEKQVSVDGLDDVACDTTDISAYIEKVKQSKYTGNDALALANKRMGTATTQDFFQRTDIDGKYEHVVYLGATDFMQHGVVAQPVLVAARGEHPAVSGLTSGTPVGGKVKTLCAQGFTKNDRCEMNSKNCGSKVWCNGYSDSNFKSSMHERKMLNSCNVIVCKDKSQALASNFNCVDYNGFDTGLCEKEDVYEEGGLVSLYGKLVKCGTGRIFNGDTCGCDVAKSVSKEIMQYGSRGRNTIMVNEQCWTKETPEDFAICVGAKSATTTSE